MGEGERHIFPTYNCLYQEVISYIKLVSKIEVYIILKNRYKNSRAENTYRRFTFLGIDSFEKFAHIVDVIQRSIDLKL